MLDQAREYTVEGGILSFRIAILHPDCPDPIVRPIVRYRLEAGEFARPEQIAAIAECLRNCADRLLKPEREHPLPRLAGQDPDADDTPLGQDMGESIGAFHQALCACNVPPELAAQRTRDYLDVSTRSLFGGAR